MGEFDELVGVSPLIIVPGNEFAEFRVEHDGSARVEDGSGWVSDEILGDDWVGSVFDDTVHLSIGGLLDGIADLVPGGLFLESAGQINNGDVSGWDSEGHTCELAVEVWDDLSDSLGGTSGGWDNIWSVGSSTSWVLDGGSVDSGVGGSSSVNGGHETLLNTEVVVDDLGKWSEAVGSAGGVGDDSLRWVVVGVVDTEDVHWGIVLGWSGEDDLLGTTFQVEVTLLFGEENTGGLADIVSAGFTPWDVDWVSLAEDSNELSVDDESLVLFVDLNSSWESSVDTVVLEEILKIAELLVWSVDGFDDSLIFLSHESRSEDESSNSTEAVDTHGSNLQFGVHMVLLHLDVGGSSGDSWSFGHHDGLGSSGGSLAHLALSSRDFAVWHGVLNFLELHDILVDRVLNWDVTHAGGELHVWLRLWVSHVVPFLTESVHGVVELGTHLAESVVSFLAHGEVLGGTLRSGAHDDGVRLSGNGVWNSEASLDVLLWSRVLVGHDWLSSLVNHGGNSEEGRLVLGDLVLSGLGKHFCFRLKKNI